MNPQREAARLMRERAEGATGWEEVVADWLDFCADQQLTSPQGFAMKVARAYLGETS